MIQPFLIKAAQAPHALPILLSSPHSGTAFPADMEPPLAVEHRKQPRDTDWFVDQLYDFAPGIGITLMHARFSRYVIDLNRHPDNRPLYQRQVTELIPSKTFDGESLFDGEISQEEVQKRKNLYFLPYYRELQHRLLELKERRKSSVLLWDCHSIKRKVPSISPQAFPDLILGSNDENSAHPILIETALRELKAGGFDVAHNSPFKGGQITRHFGQPALGIHALQLEMSQDLYMDEDQTLYLPEKAEKVRQTLKRTLSALAEALKTL